ncbi:MAG: RdgB/HAM1 family non-canonical purine NTP pyrophosphatase [Candidatus Micrarchaeota archaeon]|nr:RdgB/HAM1 family non-canonical purine NTP pyrophosphatase [Candidatus Micrarchaeota archaeon]
MDFVFVTSNHNKLREAEQILERKVAHSDIDVPEIQSINGADIVRDKAERAYKILKKPVVVEDTGLYIESLNGFPGALVKLVLVNCGTDGIARLVKRGQSRAAHAEVYIGFYDGKKMRIFSGRTDGRIALRPRGKSGFGWDVLFVPKGYTKTYSQMSSELKNKISHRGKAFRKLKRYLSRPS